MTFTASTGIYGILRSNNRETFTTIDNQTLQSSTLSYKATGFLTKLLSLPPNWKIQVNDLMVRFNMGRYSVLQRLKELQEAGYLIRQKLKNELGQFYYVHIIRETPTTTGTVNGGKGGEVLETRDTNGSSIVRFSVGGESVDEKPSILINNNSTKERIIKNPLTSEVDDENVISSEDPDTCQPPSSKSDLPQPLATSEILEKENIPPRDYKIPTKSKLNNDEVAVYQAKLGAIGIPIESVAWAIAKLHPEERAEVVNNAIAWVRENKWIKSPAAAFVAAVREQRKPSAIRSAEIAHLLDKSESQQYIEWYDRAKRARVISYGYTTGDERFAVVVLPDEVTVMPWREARDLIALI